MKKIILAPTTWFLDKLMEVSSTVSNFTSISLMWLASIKFKMNFLELQKLYFLKIGIFFLILETKKKKQI